MQGHMRTTAKRRTLRPGEWLPWEPPPLRRVYRGGMRPGDTDQRGTGQGLPTGNSAPRGHWAHSVTSDRGAAGI